MTILYNWKQTLNEVQITFDINKEAPKTNIKYSIKDRNIKITYNGDLVVEGTLTKRLDVGSEFWVKNEDSIDFFLTKQKNDWWDSLLEGGEKVDVSKLAENANVDFSMLDPEAREVIEKMAHQSNLEGNKDLKIDEE